MSAGQGTNAERIAYYAQIWREAEKAAIGAKGNRELRKAEYRARQALRRAVDAVTRGSCMPKCEIPPAVAESATTSPSSVDHG